MKIYGGSRIKKEQNKKKKRKSKIKMEKIK